MATVLLGMTAGVSAMPAPGPWFTEPRGFGGVCAAPPLIPESVGTDALLDVERAGIADPEDFGPCGGGLVVTRPDVPTTPIEVPDIIALATAAAPAGSSCGVTSRVSPDFCSVGRFGGGFRVGVAMR